MEAAHETTQHNETMHGSLEFANIMKEQLRDAQAVCGQRYADNQKQRPTIGNQNSNWQVERGTSHKETYAPAGPRWAADIHVREKGGDRGRLQTLSQCGLLIDP